MTADSLIKDDGLNGCVETRTEHEETECHDDHIGYGLDRSQRRSEETTTIEVIVGHCPKDEAVERIKGSGHDGQEITHTWNHTEGQGRRRKQQRRHSLSKYKGKGPKSSDDEDPSSPADHTVAVGVSRVAQDSLEDELPGDIGI